MQDAQGSGAVRRMLQKGTAEKKKSRMVNFSPGGQRGPALKKKSQAQTPTPSVRQRKAGLKPQDRGQRLSEGLRSLRRRGSSEGLDPSAPVWLFKIQNTAEAKNPETCSLANPFPAQRPAIPRIHFSFARIQPLGLRVESPASSESLLGSWAHFRF